MRRALIWSGVGALGAVAITVAITAAFAHTGSSSTPKGGHGYDVSWPQCSGRSAHNMPAGDPSYLVLGLTDGLGHTTNPCLAAQLGWARSHHSKVGAYLVASYPDKAQRSAAATGLYGSCHSTACRLRNDGAAQAIDAVATMRSAGLPAPRVWVDVEFRHADPWTSSNSRNADVIAGVVRGLRSEHVAMGVYTTAGMWRDILGGYRLDKPNWLPGGDGRPADARAMCDTTATGGATWLVQYTRALDEDLTCPVLDAVPGHHDKLWKFRKTTQQLFSQGAAVRALQRKVGRPATGNYDALTALAVRQWQNAHQLPITGTVGPPDWRAMGADRTHGGHPFWITKVARRA